jgi:ceramide glucosyltransferase
MNDQILLAGTFAAVASVVQISSIVAVIGRFRRRRPGAVNDDVPVSILRPVCGIDNFIEETLRSTFHLDHPNYEIVFCVADADDPVIPTVHALIAAYPHVEAKC